MVAEGEGFEPPIPCGIPVFKTGAFNRSATPPLKITHRIYRGCAAAGNLFPGVRSAVVKGGGQFSGIPLERLTARVIREERNLVDLIQRLLEDAAER